MTASAPLAFMLAGGTGGHVYPALAVAEALRDAGYRLRWIGTSRGIEARVVGGAEIPLHELPMRGLRGKGLLQKLVAAALLAVSLIWSLLLMLRYRPAVVVGMGGYASFPAAVAAWILRRPLVLQEQNAVPGSANRALARFAKLIATGFPNVLSTYGQAIYLGNPVRRELLMVAANRLATPARDRKLQVLVLGGSLGSGPLNQAIPKAAAALGNHFAWWHQCGDDHLIATRSSYAASGIADYRVDAFVDDMAAAYSWADLVICRAGALTVTELAVVGCASILVPLPHAIDDHQTANARFLADAGAAIIVTEAEVSAKLGPLLEKLRANPDAVSAMSMAALAVAKPNATRMIAERVQELAA